MKARAIDGVMGTEEASERWELSQDHIKRLCRNGKVIAKRIGKNGYWNVISRIQNRSNEI